ncbi:MAG: carbon-nitrogen hydrolase family protein [Candidatus Baltobacteraceae bacterium]
MNRSIRVAAVQLLAHDRTDFALRLDEIVARVDDAARRADLLVLPEGTFPAYVLGAAPLDAVAVASALERLREVAVATRTVIVAGAAIAEGSTLKNGAIAIDADGRIAGRADKVFLWHFDRRWFSSGERIAPIETSLGTLGVLVCADGRLPTIAGALVDRGAVALVMPTAWVTSGRDPHALENVQADLLARVRAYENGVPFIAANKCGAELGMVAYCGKSQIVDRHGEIVAIASEREAETLNASVELGASRPRRSARAGLSSRVPASAPPARIAFSFEPLPDDVDERLVLLDDQYAVAPGDDERLAALGRAIPTAVVDDAVVLDPAALVSYRRAGYALICWTTEIGPPWSQRLARARALELRLYLIVFDRAAGRAFAVDPDGTVVAGTFDGYRLASFTFDPRKSAETAVAPGTDIGEGLERVEAVIAS